MDFTTTDVATLSAQVRRGELSAAEVVDHALGRIAELNPTINAFVAVDADGARSRAAEIDAEVASGGDPGSLAGIPIGVKDLEDAAGFVTTYGSAMFAGAVPAESNSVHVQRLVDAGAIVLGKTNTPEYGHKGITENPLFGATRNPLNPDFSPGGSSGGTSAAIAAGMIPLGTGSDGGGSIRIPASLAGLTGLKTEQGVIPIAGRTMPGAGLLSLVGPMGRTALDTAIALDAVVGPDGRDPFSRRESWESFTAAVGAAAAPERVVWCPNMGFGEVDDQIAAACAAAVERLAADGTEVIEVDTVFAEDPVMPWYTLWAVQRFVTQGHLMGTPDWEKLTPSIRIQIETGAKISAADYARAEDAMYDLNWQLQEVLDQAPFVLTPTMCGQVPRIGSELGTVNGVEDISWVKYTYPINMTRNPAGTVKVGVDADNIPIGLQVIGHHGADPDVLSCLAHLEA